MTFGPDNTPFDSMGGEDRVRLLVDAFYDQMEEAAEFSTIRAMHPANLDESRQKLFEFLCGWLGGPPLYMERRGHPKLRIRHAPFSIGVSERDQWLSCMGHAMDQLAIDGELREFLEGRFAQVADFMRNKPGENPEA